MFFGLTIREDDKRQLLMGQATLGPHELDGQLYDAYAQFSPTKGDELPLPFEGSVAEAFKVDFALGRGVEPGLSIVIPLPHEELADVGLQRVRRAIIANCFPQIAAGFLECDVAGAPLNRTTLKAWAVNFPDLNLEAAIDMAVEVFDPERPAPFSATAVDRNAELTDQRFEKSALAEMRAAFADGRTISARIPIIVRKRGAAVETGYLLTHLRRVQEDQHGAEIYVRGRVTVPKQRKVLVSRNVVGLLVAEDGPLSEFLGDAEPPSHVRWTAVNVREKAKYVTPDETLRIAATTLRQLERLVQDESLERIFEDAFKDFFWRPKPQEPKPKPKTDSDGKPDLPPARAFWEVRKRQGGFEVARTDKEAPPSVAVEVAYARRRGKPDWKPTDFQLHGGAIDLKQTGAAIVEADGNVIKIDAAELGFSVTATGFDPNRDLVVKVLAVEEVLDAAAA